MATAPTLYWYQLNVGTYAPLYYKQLDTTVRDLCTENSVSPPTAFWYNPISGTLVSAWISQIDRAVRTLCAVLSVNPPVTPYVNQTAGQYEAFYFSQLDACVRELCGTTPPVDLGERFVGLGSDLAWARSTLGNNIMRVYHQYCFAVDTPYVKVAFPGFYVTQAAEGEVTLGNSANTPTLRAHLTIGSDTQVFTFDDGETEVSLPDVGTLWTDNLQASAFGLETFSAYTTFYIYWELNFENTGGFVPVTSGVGQGFLSGERWYDGGTSWWGLPGTPTQGVATSYQRYSKALAIVGQTDQVAFVAFGDSITHGKNDNYGGYGDDNNGGWFTQACFQVGAGGCKLGIDGARVVEVIGSSNMQNRLALMPYADICTLNYGTNDLSSGDAATVAQFLTDIDTLCTNIRAVNPRLYITQQKVLIRCSATTDNWQTVGNMTVFSGYGSSADQIRAMFAVDLDDGIGIRGWDDSFNLADTVNNVSNQDKWLTNGTTDYGTPDGTHPSILSYGLMAVNGAAPYFATLLIAKTVPNQFIFIDKTEASLGTTYVSNTIRVSGITAASTMTIVDGQYQINSGAWASTSTTVVNGDLVAVRGIAPGSFAQSTSVILTIGGVSDTYSISTASSADDTPVAFTFTAQSSATLSTAVDSNAVLITGINVPADISITGTGFTYSIDGGIPTSSPGTVLDGQFVTLHVTSSGSYETLKSGTLSVGGTYGSPVTGTFNVTTAALWAFVGIYTDPTSPTGDITVQEPPGTQDGDLLIIGIAYRDVQNYTYPVGWVDAATPWTGANTASDNTGIPAGLLVYQIRSGAPNLTFVRSATGGVSKVNCWAYRRITGTPTLDQASSNRNSIASTLVTTPTMTTPQASELLVGFCFQARNSSITNIHAATDPSTAAGVSPVTTNPTSANWSLRVSSGTSSGAHVRAAVADAIKGTASATGTFSYTSATGAKDGMMVAAFI